MVLRSSHQFAPDLAAVHHELKPYTIPRRAWSDLVSPADGWLSFEG